MCTGALLTLPLNTGLHSEPDRTLVSGGTSEHCHSLYTSNTDLEFTHGGLQHSDSTLVVDQSSIIITSGSLGAM